MPRTRAVVLAYHRVKRLADDPQLLAVTPDRFDEQLAALTRRFTPVSLDELVGAMRGDTLPERAVAITFDDGYEDNLTHALPLLEKHDVPATVFVTSGTVASRSELWWDELERLILRPETVPCALRLSIRGKAHGWELAPTPSAATAPPACFKWDVTQGIMSPRQRAYMDLHRLLKPLNHAAIADVLAQLREAVGAAEAGRETHRTLSADQLRALAASPQITIGAHTVTHPQLSARPRRMQRRELRDSKVALASIIGCDVWSMSYPYGGYGDFSPATRRLARRCGYRAAFANRPGLANGMSDLYAIPRVLVRDVGEHRFHEQLAQYFGPTLRQHMPLEIAA